MSFQATARVLALQRKHPEIKLTPNAWRVLIYLADCANEKAAQENGGRYFAFPRQSDFLDRLAIGSGTLYRALDQLEYGCGFYLITRRNRKDARAALYDLHILDSDLTGEALEARKQFAEARLSRSRGREGERKRNAVSLTPVLPQITSQNGRYYGESPAALPPQTGGNYLPKSTNTHEITSQNGSYNQEGICTNRESNQESSPDDGTLRTADDAVPIGRRAYTAAVWATFCELPGAKRRRPSPQERKLIGEWFAGGVPAANVCIALWEGFGRRIKELGAAPPRINSLEYFRTIVPDIAMQAQRFSNSRTAAFVLERMRQQVLDAIERPKVLAAKAGRSP